MSEDAKFLSQAWDAFCDELKESGQLALRDTIPDGALDRAVGYRMIARNIALALQFSLENGDPLNPEIMRFYDPLRKQGGDNGDALYCYAPINGTETYKISGTIGSAHYVSFAAVDDGPTPWGGGVSQLLFGDDLEIAEDGRFEIILSPEKQPGNWLRTGKDTFRVVIRQFFGDWEHEEPMRIKIDRISAAELPLPTVTADQIASGLVAAAKWTRDSIAYFLDSIEKWQIQPNRFLSFQQVDGKMGATPGGVPLVAYWQLPADEAIILRIRPPEARYWAIEFGNHWFETMDYRYRLCSTNIHHAHLEEDGELIVVIAHDDPGLPNWLDPSGHSAGYAIVRWMGAAENPAPECLQVKRRDLYSHLPANVRRISADERRAQLRSRRRGALNRFAM